MEALHTLFYFIVAIAVLVAFHEFGHFWVARKTGVKVIRFSIGFGKRLWGYQRSQSETEFVICAVPLGGYVKMVDEREGQVAQEDLPFAFNRQRLAVRSAIVAAGPVFNLVLAVIMFWLVFVIGETGMRPIVGKIEPDTLASQAGFIEGDEILRVNQKLTPTWNTALDELLSSAIDGGQVIEVTVKTADGDEANRWLTLGEDDVKSPETLSKRMGLNPWIPKIRPIIGKLTDDGVAKAAGFQSGDVILSANGIVVGEWQNWVDFVKERPGVEITVVIERSDVQQEILLIPRPEQQADGSVIGKIGAGVDIPDTLMQDFTVSYTLPVGEAFVAAIDKTWFYSTSTLKMIGKMFVGTASVDNLSGPISIAQYAGQSAEMGLTSFLKFLGLVSVSLGVLNLLPVPVLDGGHLLFFMLEAIKGSPISERVQLYFQQFGMFLLISLMMLSLVLDVDRLVQ